MVNGNQATFSDDGHALWKFSCVGKSVQGLCNMSHDVYVYLFRCILDISYKFGFACMTQYIRKHINHIVYYLGCVRYKFCFRYIDLLKWKMCLLFLG